MLASLSMSIFSEISNKAGFSKKLSKSSTYFPFLKYISNENLECIKVLYIFLDL